MITAFALSFNVAAIAVYLAASGYLVVQFVHKEEVNKLWLLALACCALTLHGLGVTNTIFSSDGLQFGIFKVSSLIFWVINTIVLASSLKKPLHNLFVLLFPLSALAVLISIFSNSPQLLYAQLDQGLISHILLSILAYSLLTIASMQALLLAFQNHQLRSKQPTGAVRLLPPLQTMEALLFEILWAGMLLLTLSIATGFIFLHDIFAQHLAHKTLFSLLAWCIYATLLWGRHKLGWRGNTAIRWTLVGFTALMLAYFGSKLVLEVLL